MVIKPMDIGNYTHKKVCPKLLANLEHTLIFLKTFFYCISPPVTNTFDAGETTVTTAY
jgi:hypothetical protein